MELNFIAIGIAAVVQFIVGAIWYMPLFGGVWGRMHGFDALSPEAQKSAQKQMMPLLVIQFFVTCVTTTVFALLVTGLPAEWNRYGLALFFWLGFVLPTQVSAVLFGGTEPRWVVKKIMIMSGGSLVNYLMLALVLGWF
jgi:hypothetical protein